MSMQRLTSYLGRARDWWSRDDADGVALGGPALDPAYNGWYVTAVPQHGTADAADVGDDDPESSTLTESH